MMKEAQRQNRMRRPPFMPDKDGEQNNPRSDERGLDHSDFSLTEIDKRPHQAAAARAGEQRARQIESTDALPDALVHPGDDKERRYHGDRHVDEERPAP